MTLLMRNSTIKNTIKFPDFVDLYEKEIREFNLKTTPSSQVIYSLITRLNYLNRSEDNPLSTKRLEFLLKATVAINYAYELSQSALLERKFIVRKDLLEIKKWISKMESALKKARKEQYR